MRSSCQDFIVGCCAEANWVGYGRGLELLYEFLDFHHRMLDDNQEFIDFLNWKVEGVDVGRMPERMAAKDLADVYSRKAMWSDEDVLSVFSEYVDESEADLQQALMGFFNDMVEYHGSEW